MSLSLVKTLIIFSILRASQTVFAGTIGGGLVDPLGGATFETILKKITGFLLTIAIPIVSIMVLVGGFQMMTAGGDPEKFSKGKKTILYAAIGFVVVLLADSVATLIKNFLGA